MRFFLEKFLNMVFRLYILVFIVRNNVGNGYILRDVYFTNTGSEMTLNRYQSILNSYNF